MKPVSQIYKKDTFLNKNIFYLFNREIVEYDMEDAGFSLIQEFGLLPDKEIERLKKKGKQKRKIAIGIIQKNDKKFRTDLKEAFSMARESFFISNGLEEEDVISIKKDAIFTKRRCEVEKVGSYINFRKKHEYTSYILLGTKKGKPLEIYYGPFDFAVKGISDSLLAYHEDYMIDFMKRFFSKMQTSDKTSVLQFMRRFVDKYKRRALEMGYYRNFNIVSDFTIINEPDVVYMDYDSSAIEDIDISYNYFNILLKLLKIPL